MCSLRKPEWLLFVEDPGALNYFLPLIKELESHRFPFLLYAAGHAVELLKQRDIAPLRLSKEILKTCCEAVSLVIVGTSENPDSLAFELIAIAKQQFISSAAIVDSGINSAHRFRGRTKNSLFHAPEYLLVPDDWAADEYAQQSFDPKNIYIVGHPMANLKPYIESRNLIRSRTLPAEALNRFVLVFISEISTGLCPEQYHKSERYILHGRGESKLRTEIVVEELLDAVARLVGEGFARPYMILRRHPKETDQDLKFLAQEFDFISTTCNPIDVVYSADLVVGMSSMLLNEAYAIGSKVLAVLPREEEQEWLSFTRDGNIKCVMERSNLLYQLRLYLFEKNCAEIKINSIGSQHYDLGKQVLDALLSIQFKEKSNINKKITAS